MIAAAAYAARGMELSGSMGSRPRLSADAAFAAYSNPGLPPGDYLFKNSFPPRSVVILARISHRGAGHRLGKCLSLASCSAFWGNLQGTDCAGRAWACLRSNTRDDCCRRLRGSGDGVIGFHGLTPTAKCGRRIRGLLEPRAGARGLFYLKIPFPPRSVVILGRAVKPRLAWLTRGNVPYRSSL